MNRTTRFRIRGQDFNPIKMGLKRKGKSPLKKCFANSFKD